jgi:hypothetical protein
MENSKSEVTLTIEDVNRLVESFLLKEGFVPKEKVYFHVKNFGFGPGVECYKVQVEYKK